jgi:hypothetical protein
MRPMLSEKETDLSGQKYILLIDNSAGLLYGSEETNTCSVFSRVNAIPLATRDAHFYNRRNGSGNRHNTYHLFRTTRKNNPRGEVLLLGKEGG